MCASFSSHSALPTELEPVDFRVIFSELIALKHLSKCVVPKIISGTRLVTNRNLA